MGVSKRVSAIEVIAMIKQVLYHSVSYSIYFLIQVMLTYDSEHESGFDSFEGLNYPLSRGMTQLYFLDEISEVFCILTDRFRSTFEWLSPESHWLSVLVFF